VLTKGRFLLVSQLIFGDEAKKLIIIISVITSENIPTSYDV